MIHSPFDIGTRWLGLQCLESVIARRLKPSRPLFPLMKYSPLPRLDENLVDHYERVFSFLTFYWLDCERDSLVKVMQSSLHKLLCVLFNWHTFTIAAWQVMYLTLNCRARLSLAAERVSVWASKFSAEPVSFRLMIFVVFICISWLFMLSSLLHLISFAHHRCRKKKRHPAYAIVFLVMIFTSRPSMLGLVRGISELYLVREWLWYIRYDLIESIASTVDSLPTVQ